MTKSGLKDYKVEKTSRMPSFKDSLSTSELEQLVGLLVFVAAEGRCSMKRIWVASVVIMLACVATPLHAQLTYERLLKAEQDPGNWLTYSGNYRSWRYSPLTRSLATTRAN